MSSMISESPTEFAEALHRSGWQDFHKRYRIQHHSAKSCPCKRSLRLSVGRSLYVPSAQSTPRSAPAATHVSICLSVASSCWPKIFVFLISLPIGFCVLTLSCAKAPRSARFARVCSDFALPGVYAAQALQLATPTPRNYFTAKKWRVFANDAELRRTRQASLVALISFPAFALRSPSGFARSAQLFARSAERVPPASR